MRGKSSRRNLIKRGNSRTDKRREEREKEKSRRAGGEER